MPRIGQRQGDLLRLTWKAYNGSTIRLRQSKSIGCRRRVVNVEIPVGAPLKAALDAASKLKSSLIILLNSDGRPWTQDGFRASFIKARDKAGIGATFNDTRGTAVTRLALAECTETQIVAITGHSLNDVRSIIDPHCLHRDPELTRAAIYKLENLYAKAAEG